MKKTFLIIAVLIVIVFSGCSEYFPDNEANNNGDTLTPEIMKQISESMNTTAAPGNQEKTAVPDSDKVSRLSSDSSELPPSESGTADTEKAKAETSTDDVATATETTGKKTTDTETTGKETSVSSTGTNSPEIIVYWTTNGSVWHTNKNCSSLKRSSEIISGTMEQAKAAGKQRPCKRCG